MTSQQEAFIEDIQCNLCFKQKSISKSFDNMFISDCKHVFCRNCLRESYEKNQGKISCTVCKKLFPPTSFHPPVFLKCEYGSKDFKKLLYGLNPIEIHEISKEGCQFWYNQQKLQAYVARWQNMKLHKQLTQHAEKCKDKVVDVEKQYENLMQELQTSKTELEVLRKELRNVKHEHVRSKNINKNLQKELTEAQRQVSILKTGRASIPSPSKSYDHHSRGSRSPRVRGQKINKDVIDLRPNDSGNKGHNPFLNTKKRRTSSSSNPFLGMSTKRSVPPPDAFSSNPMGMKRVKRMETDFSGSVMSFQQRQAAVYQKRTPSPAFPSMISAQMFPSVNSRAFKNTGNKNSMF